MGDGLVRDKNNQCSFNNISRARVSCSVGTFLCTPSLITNARSTNSPLKIHDLPLAASYWPTVTSEQLWVKNVQPTTVGRGTKGSEGPIFGAVGARHTFGRIRGSTQTSTLFGFVATIGIT